MKAIILRIFCLILALCMTCAAFVACSAEDEGNAATDSAEITEDSGEEVDDASTDEQGFLLADEDGVSPTDGIFVAGDIRAKNCRQLITAAGDGAAAMCAVERYLNEK